MKRYGEAILHLDHFCIWLGHPVGHRNRRYFILYLFWSTLLTLYGGLLALHDLHYLNPLASWPQPRPLTTWLSYAVFPLQRASDVYHTDGLIVEVAHHCAVTALAFVDILLGVRSRPLSIQKAPLVLRRARCASSGGC